MPRGIFFVSIPYSSGQCFFKIRNTLPARGGNEFQSLIHQVSVSLGQIQNTSPTRDLMSFNPLFIRSVFLYWKTGYFSESFPPSLFQSLIHQVSVSLIHPCLPRRHHRCQFQSLIHQVSVSLQGKLEKCKSYFQNVSIPYSSGQCFFSSPPGEGITQTGQCFNPLFIRSVFLLC